MTVRLCAAAGLIVPMSVAGPLTPPGAPEPTAPLVEPRVAVNTANTPGDADSVFRIAAPGSYYLTDNVEALAGFHGIEIASNDVVLDLNGFALRGAQGSLSGVIASVDVTNVAVRNGTVSGFGQRGVDLNPGGATVNGLIEAITATSNGGHGIRGGLNTVIRDCAVYLNGGDGIITSTGGTITGCTARQSTGAGINGAAGTVVTNCSSRQNDGDGIIAGGSAIISGYAASFNGDDGIHVQGNALVTGNVCTSNSQNNTGGIRVAGGNNRVEGNNCANNSTGILVVGSGNWLVGNTCSDNATNWNVAAGNAVLVIEATAAGAFTGNSGGTSLGTTNPFANFTH